MMKKILLFIAWITPSLWTYLSAQSLDELLKIASQNNAELQGLQAEYEANLQQLGYVGTLPNPDISIGLMVNGMEMFMYDHEVSHDLLPMGRQVMQASVSQMFSWKGERTAQKDEAFARSQSKLWQKQAMALNIKAEVKKTYFQWWKVEQTAAVLNQNLTWLDALERLATQRIETAKGSVSQVFRLQLQKNTVQNQLQRLALERQPLKAQMERLLNQPLNEDFSPTDSLKMVILPFQKDSLKARLTAHHPLVEVVKNIQLAENQRITQLSYQAKPQVGVGLNYTFVLRDPMHNSDANGQDMAMPMLMVKMPLNLKKYEAQKQEIALNQVALEHRKAAVANSLWADFEGAWSEVEIARLNLQLIDNQLVIIKNLKKILETDYANGQAEWSELLALEMDILAYELQKIETITSANIAFATLETLFFQ